MRTYFFTGIWLLLWLPSTVHGQKFFNNNFYLLNPYSYNMAYANQYKELNITAQFAGPNSGLPSAARTSSVFLRKGLFGEAGVGVRLMIDERGIFKSTRIMLEGAYRIVINPGTKHFFRFGISGGASWENINIELIERHGYADLNDPVLYADALRRSDIQFGAGMVYQIQGLEVGISAPFLVGLYSGQRDKASFWKYFSASLGYTFELGDNWRLQPFFISQRMAAGLQLFDAVLFADVLRKYSLQVGYRSNKALLTTAGIRIGPAHVGYSMELPFGDYSTLAGAAHSVMLAFAIDENVLYNKKKKKKAKGFLPGGGKKKGKTTETQEEYTFIVHVLLRGVCV